MHVTEICIKNVEIFFSSSSLRTSGSDCEVATETQMKLLLSTIDVLDSKISSYI